MKRIVVAVAVSMGLLAAAPCQAQGAAGGGGDMKERVAALKQSMAASQQALRSYQWIETTKVSFKGEQKSFKEQSCYYGADGKIQKTTLAQSAPPKKKGGLRGKIAAEKQQEMSDTMKQAVALVKTYVPPPPAAIQRAVDAGKVSVEAVQPGKTVRLVIRDYELPGDSLAITLDASTNRLQGIDVATYLGSPSKPVTMKTTMGALQDGTTYTAGTSLSLPAEQLTVDVSNSGYRKM